MVTIRRAEPRSIMRTRNPVPIRGAESARRVGEAIYTAGQGLSAFGEAVARKEKDEDKLNQAAYNSRIASEGAMKAAEVRERLVRDKNDGKVDLATFQEEMDAFRKDWREKNKVDEKFWTGMDKAFATAISVPGQQVVVNAATKGTERTVENMNASIQSNMNSVDLDSSDANLRLMYLKQAVDIRAFGEAKKQSEETIRYNIAAKQKEMLEIAIASKLRKNLHDDAEALLVSREYSKHFSTKERLAQQETIRTYRRQHINDKYRDQTRQEQQAKLALEKESERKAKELYARLPELDDPKKHQRFEAAAEEYFKDFKSVRQHVDWLKSAQRKRYDLLDNTTSFEISKKLGMDISVANVTEMEELVSQKVNMHMLSKESGIAWHNKLRSIKEKLRRKSVDPAYKMKIKGAKARLDSVLYPDSIISASIRSTIPGTPNKMAGIAYQEFYNSLAKGEDPEKAVNRIIRSHFPGRNGITVFPGGGIVTIPNSPDNVKKAAYECDTRYGKSSLTPNAQKLRECSIWLLNAETNLAVEEQFKTLSPDKKADDLKLPNLVMQGDVPVEEVMYDMEGITDENGVPYVQNIDDVEESPSIDIPYAE